MSDDAPHVASRVAPHEGSCASFVVVMGVAGAGKTTVGQALAAALGRPFHDADDFHPPENVARMRAGIALTDADRAPWLAALRALIDRALAERAPAVLACSALRQAYRDALVPPDAPPHAVRFVHLSIDRALAARRLAERVGHYMPGSLIDSQFATLEPPTPAAPDAIALDAALPVDVLVAAARRALGC